MNNLKTYDNYLKEGLFANLFGSEYKDIVSKIYNYIKNMDADTCIRKLNGDESVFEFEYAKPIEPKNKDIDPYGEENWDDQPPPQKLKIKIKLETDRYYPELFINSDNVDITRKEAIKLSNLVIDKVSKRKDEIKKERIRRAADIL